MKVIYNGSNWDLEEVGKDDRQAACNLFWLSKKEWLNKQLDRKWQEIDAAHAACYPEGGWSGEAISLANQLEAKMACELQDFMIAETKKINEDYRLMCEVHGCTPQMLA
jgi:hypothetical protein